MQRRQTLIVKEMNKIDFYECEYNSKIGCIHTHICRYCRYKVRGLVILERAVLFTVMPAFEFDCVFFLLLRKEI